MIIAKDKIGAEDVIIESKGNPSDYLLADSDRQIMDDHVGTYRILSGLVKGYLGLKEGLLETSKYRSQQFKDLQTLQEQYIHGDQELVKNLIERKHLMVNIWAADKWITELEIRKKNTAKSIHKLMESRHIPAARFEIPIETKDTGTTVRFKYDNDGKCWLDGELVKA
jgi:hypothetical protein